MIFKWFVRLWIRWTCEHKWEQIKHVTVYPEGDETDMPVAHKYLFKCNGTCGGFKKIKM